MAQDIYFAKHANNHMKQKNKRKLTIFSPSVSKIISNYFYMAHLTFKYMYISTCVTPIGVEICYKCKTTIKYFTTGRHFYTFGVHIDLMSTVMGF